MITVSLCMIVRNEEDVLSRCLESILPAADEIIIVDTGSSDRTKEIALRYTKQVLDFVWTDDFSAARNVSFAKASMDYCMWLDADDVVTEDNLRKLLELKQNLDPAVDMVMMDYSVSEDAEGRPLLSYCRERLIRNGKGFLWEGPVHEAIPPSGNILYSDITISHRKIKAGDPGRNLRIYESLLARGVSLDQRGQFYYARELFFHRRYKEAADVFVRFLQEDAWAENQIEACLNLAECYRNLGLHQQKLTSLFHSFLLGPPRGEVCCEIGRHFLETGAYETAVFWYQAALHTRPPVKSGAFIRWECYGCLPEMNLAICRERLGRADEPNLYD